MQITGTYRNINRVEKKDMDQRALEEDDLTKNEPHLTVKPGRF